MKKLLFASALCLASFSFANTTTTKEVNAPVKAEVESLKNENFKFELSKKAMFRPYYEIQFEINCPSGNSGMMTVIFPSDNWGWAFIADVVNAINSGTEEGCKKMAEMGL